MTKAFRDILQLPSSFKEGVAVKLIPPRYCVLPFIFFGVALARKKGSEKTLVTGSIGAIGAFACLAVLLMLIQPGDISQEKIGLKAILFLLFYGCYMIPGNIVIPMIAACSDYETYRSGRLHYRHLHSGGRRIFCILRGIG